MYFKTNVLFKLPTFFLLFTPFIIVSIFLKGMIDVLLCSLYLLSAIYCYNRVYHKKYVVWCMKKKNCITWHIDLLFN